jgi:stage V sporulation protein T
MKATGIIRRIDDLGRIVIPKEIRKTMHIRESDPLEIFTERDGDIILKKYSPIGELGNSAKLYAESIAAQIPHTICICDQDCVIAAAGPNAKKLMKLQKRLFGFKKYFQIKLIEVIFQMDILLQK